MRSHMGLRAGGGSRRELRGGGGSSAVSARGGGSAAPQGPRGRSGPGGGSSSRSRRKERARGGDPGRRIQQSLFTEGGGSGETRQSVCAWLAAGSAGGRGGGIPRLSPCPPQGSGTDPAGRREEPGPGARRGAGQPRRRRVPGEPQQRLGKARSVRRGVEGEGDAAPLAVSPARFSPRPLAGQAVPGSVPPGRSPAPPRRRRCRPGEQRSRCRRCRRRGHFVAD